MNELVDEEPFIAETVLYILVLPHNILVSSPFSRSAVHLQTVQCVSYLSCYRIVECLNGFFFVRKRKNKSKRVTARIYPMKHMLITLSVSHRP